MEQLTGNYWSDVSTW